MSADEDTELRDLVAQTLEANGVLGKIRVRNISNCYSRMFGAYKQSLKYQSILSVRQNPQTNGWDFQHSTLFNFLCKPGQDSIFLLDSCQKHLHLFMSLWFSVLYNVYFPINSRYVTAVYCWLYSSVKVNPVNSWTLQQFKDKK